MRKEERDRIKARRDRLVTENDQLKARVQELEQAIRDASGRLQFVSSGEGFVGINKEAAIAILNRQPAQSLALLKAEVLEEAVDQVDKACGEFWTTDDVIYFFQGLAAQLRKEAGE